MIDQCWSIRCPRWINRAHISSIWNSKGFQIMFVRNFFYGLLGGIHSIGCIFDVNMWTQCVFNTLRPTNTVVRKQFSCCVKFFTVLDRSKQKGCSTPPRLGDNKDCRSIAHRLALSMNKRQLTEVLYQVKLKNLFVKNSVWHVVVLIFRTHLAACSFWSGVVC